MQVFYPDGASVPAPRHPLAGSTAFTVKRRVSMREQYYEVRPLSPDGTEAGVALFASLKQVSLPEEYRFSGDREHRQRWLTVRARTHLNLLNAVFDAFDENGAPVGWFQYRWLESEVLHTWRLVGPGVDVTGHQTSALVGFARRTLVKVPFAQLMPIPYAFDVAFRDSADQVVLRVERRPEMRDRYVVTLPGARVDPRMGAAMTVLMDFRGAG